MKNIFKFFKSKKEDGSKKDIHSKQYWLDKINSGKMDPNDPQTLTDYMAFKNKIRHEEGKDKWSAIEVKLDDTRPIIYFCGMEPGCVSSVRKDEFKIGGRYFGGGYLCSYSQIGVPMSVKEKDKGGKEKGMVFGGSMMPFVVKDSDSGKTFASAGDYNFNFSSVDDDGYDVFYKDKHEVNLLDSGGGYLWLNNSKDNIVDGKEKEIFYNDKLIYKGVINPVALDQVPEKDQYQAEELKNTIFYIQCFGDDDDKFEEFLEEDGGEYGFIFDKVKKEYNWE